MFRTVRTVEAFTNFVRAAGDDRSAEFTCEGNNQLVILTARKAEGNGGKGLLNTPGRPDLEVRPARCALTPENRVNNSR